MFRPMRRKKREIDQDAAREILAQGRIGVLAVNGDDGYPYAVPVNYLFDGEAGKIYFHGARAGHKYESIQSCDKVCFTVYGPENVKEETWAPFVRSAVVFGRCRAVALGPEALENLKRLAMKYYPEEALADREIAKDGRAVQMYEIEIEHLSGKEVQER